MFVSKKCLGSNFHTVFKRSCISALALRCEDKRSLEKVISKWRRSVGRSFQCVVRCWVHGDSLCSWFLVGCSESMLWHSLKTSEKQPQRPPKQTWKKFTQASQITVLLQQASIYFSCCFHPGSTNLEVQETTKWAKMELFIIRRQWTRKLSTLHKKL